MRRASQRHSLVMLNEINITPLLDLAFVLLIIFIITRPALEQSMQLDLPTGGGPAPKLEAKDFARVEVNAQGNVTLNGRPLALAQVEPAILALRQQNPRLVVLIAADRSTEWGNGVEVIEICKKHDIPLNIQTKQTSE
jgi:biopolymer transport protein ExbD